MALNFSELEVEVTRNPTVDGSLKELFVGIAAIIEEGAQAKINALATKLRTDNDSVVAFVLANTPAAPPVELPAEDPPAEDPPAEDPPAEDPPAP